MPENIARLAIVVDTKGVKQSTKEIGELTKRVKTLEGQLKSSNKTKTKSTKKQKSFTTAMGQFRKTLPGVASGVYLVQQAYHLLSGALGVVMEAYEAQYSAEIKLQTILASTTHAIGMTYDELYVLAQAWQAQTGVNDAVILNAAAIAATFTQISEEVIPDVIEQALNMSAIFGQDLKQSMIQLGTATNDPVKGLGRLRRIGISFSTQQREMINAMVASGDVLGAQKAIMAELEIEIGNVAKAMGETSLGSLKKYKTAWTNVFEELGEATTNFLGDIAKKITPALEEFFSFLKTHNDIVNVGEIIGLADITDEAKTVQLPLNALQDALAGVTDQIVLLDAGVNGNSVMDKIKNLTPLAGGLIGLLIGNKKYDDNKQQLDDLTALRKGIIKFIALREQFNKDSGSGGDDPILGEGAEEWLKQLKKAEQYKRGLTNLDEIALKYEKERKTRADEVLAIEAAGVKLGYDKQVIADILIKYTKIYNTDLKEQETIARGLLAGKAQEVAEAKRLSDIDLYGTENQQKQAKVEAYTYGIIDAMGNLGYSWDQVNEKIEEYKASMEGVSEDKETTFLGIFIDQLTNARKEAELFDDVVRNLADSMIGLGVDLLSGSFDYLGKSIAGVGEGADSWEVAMQKIVASSLSAVGPNLMLAGTQMLVASLGTSVAGWGLLAAGATMSGIGGFLAQDASNAGSDSQELGVSSTATNEVVADFSSDSRSLGSTSIQNNIINNTNSEVTTRATTAPDGRVMLETIVDSAVKKTASTYGLQRAGRNVR